MSEKKKKRSQRRKRGRKKIFGMPERPRLCVFRSGKHIYAQLIDDEKGKILTAASDLELKNAKQGKVKSSKPQLKVKNLREEKKETVRTRKVALAYEVGKLIAEKALQKKIEKIVFDRRRYKYHGQTKALAEGAREGGLKF